MARKAEIEGSPREGMQEIVVDITRCYDQQGMDESTLRALKSNRLLGADYLYSGCSFSTVLTYTSNVSPGAVFCLDHNHIAAAASSDGGLSERVLNYTVKYRDGVLVVYHRSQLRRLIDCDTEYTVPNREAIRAVLKFKGPGFQYMK